MSKLNYGDIYEYKRDRLLFTAKIIEKKTTSFGTFYTSEVLEATRGGLRKEQKVVSHSEEEKYMRIIHKEPIEKNIKVKAKNGKDVWLNLRILK